MNTHNLLCQFTYMEIWNLDLFIILRKHICYHYSCVSLYYCILVSIFFDIWSCSILWQCKLHNKERMGSCLCTCGRWVCPWLVIQMDRGPPGDQYQSFVDIRLPGAHRQLIMEMSVSWTLRETINILLPSFLRVLNRMILWRSWIYEYIGAICFYNIKKISSWHKHEDYVMKTETLKVCKDIKHSNEALKVFSKWK